MAFVVAGLLLLTELVHSVWLVRVPVWGQIPDPAIPLIIAISFRRPACCCGRRARRARGRGSMSSEPATRRLAAFAVVVVLLFTLLLGRLWQMQVLQGGYYLQLSEENRRRATPKRVVPTVEENRLDLPGVIIEVEPVRHNLYGSLAAHGLGYLGEINPSELASPQGAGDRMGGPIGEGGGGRRPLRARGREPSHPGKSLVLTIDLDIQQAAEAALGDKAGAVVVLDPRNGEVLASASHPTVDPTVFSAGISPDAWGRIAGDRRLPLLHRAADST